MSRLLAKVTTDLVSVPRITFVPCRTKYYNNRPPNPKWRKQRAWKVWKIDLPDFDKMRYDSKNRNPSIEEMRSQYKERGVAPPNPWQEREVYNPCTIGLIEPYQGAEDGKSSSLISSLKNPLASGKDFVKNKRAVGDIRNFEREDIILKEFTKVAISVPNIFSSPLLGPSTILAAKSYSKPIFNMETIRQFHAVDSKVHYLDYRYRYKTGKLRLHLTIIRRKKMKKHQRKKWRKKFKSLLAKERLKREIAKEKAFRVELLTMIREAEQFDPKEFALRKIAEANDIPQEKSKEELFEELKEKIRINRYQVDYVKPKHRTCDTIDSSHFLT